MCASVHQVFIIKVCQQKLFSINNIDLLNQYKMNVYVLVSAFYLEYIHILFECQQQLSIIKILIPQ